MSFDRAFFDNISLAAVRGKFYNKAEVDSLLKEIAAKAELQSKENELLQLKLDNAEKAMADKLAAEEATRELAQAMIEDAKSQSAAILAEAQQQAANLLPDAKAQAADLLEQAGQTAQSIIARGEDRRERIIGNAVAAKENLLAEIAAAFAAFLKQEEPEETDEEPEIEVEITEEPEEAFEAEPAEEAEEIIPEEFPTPDSFVLPEEPLPEEPAEELPEEEYVLDEDFPLDEETDSYAGQRPFDLEEKINAIARELDEIVNRDRESMGRGE